MLVAALCFCSSCARETTVPAVTVPVPQQRLAAPEAAVDPQLGDHLVQRVAEAERAYEERGDPHAILALIAPDARIEAARLRRHSRTDWVFTHERLTAIYTWAAQYAAQTRFSYKDVHVTAGATYASFDWVTMSEGPDQQSWFGQHYELERRGGEWKVVRFRYWPLRPDTGGEFGAPYFADLDRQIETALGSGDERNAAYWMMLAYRFDECAKLGRKLTDAMPTDWWAWDMRSRASAMVGDLDDALSAGRVARSLKK
jgi:hypothetical protein